MDRGKLQVQHCLIPWLEFFTPSLTLPRQNPQTDQLKLILILKTYTLNLAQPVTILAWVSRVTILLPLVAYNWQFWVREGVQKKRFFGRSFPNVGGWGGWFPNKVQTPQTPPQIPRKSPFSTQISPFVFPNLTKTLGWVNTFGKYLPKNVFLFNAFP